MSHALKLRALTVGGPRRGATAVLLAGLLACSHAVGGPNQPNAIKAEPGDYGDAPDGVRAGYAPPFQGVLGQFPTNFYTTSSRYGLRGGHTKVVGQEWLGDVVSIEVGARDQNDPDRAENLVDDDFDDGMVSGPCAVGAPIAPFPNPMNVTFSFRVSVAAGAPNITRYINVLIDKNHDGVWKHYPEWVVVDMPVVIAPGTSQIVATPPLALAAATSDTGWMRVALTRTPVVGSFPDNGTGWDGSGTFSAGEIEDYLPVWAMAYADAAASAAARARDIALAIATDEDFAFDAEATFAGIDLSVHANAPAIAVAAAQASATAAAAAQASASASASATATSCAAASASAAAIAVSCASCPCATVCAAAGTFVAAAVEACSQASTSASTSASAAASAYAMASARAVAAAAAQVDLNLHVSAYASAHAAALAYASSIGVAMATANAEADAAAAAAALALAQACGGSAQAAAGAAAMANAHARAAAAALADAQAYAVALATAWADARVAVELTLRTRTLTETHASWAAYAHSSASASASAAASAQASSSASAAAVAAVFTMAYAACNDDCCPPCPVYTPSGHGSYDGASGISNERHIGSSTLTSWTITAYAGQGGQITGFRWLTVEQNPAGFTGMADVAMWDSRVVDCGGADESNALFMQTMPAQRQPLLNSQGQPVTLFGLPAFAYTVQMPLAQPPGRISFGVRPVLNGAGQSFLLSAQRLPEDEPAYFRSPAMNVPRSTIVCDPEVANSDHAYCVQLLRGSSFDGGGDEDETDGGGSIVVDGGVNPVGSEPMPDVVGPSPAPRVVIDGRP